MAWQFTRVDGEGSLATASLARRPPGAAVAAAGSIQATAGMSARGSHFMLGCTLL
jgi:hypothetical protein